MAWENLITYFEGFPCPINNSSTQQRIECLVKGINRIRFECCLEQRGQIKYVRAPEGHSGGVSIDPTLHNNVLIYLFRMDRSHVSRWLNLGLPFRCRRRFTHWRTTRKTRASLQQSTVYAKCHISSDCGVPVCEKGERMRRAAHCSFLPAVV